MSQSKFKDIVKNLPKKPGVYRFYSFDDTLLYIGKAKNLKNRVSSYFQEGRPKNERLSLMVSQIERVEYTVVANEEESLILEANLIHNLQPKYNVLLKDDKNYVYIRITNDEIPGIFLVRKKFDPKSIYFGPYTKKFSIQDTLRTIRTILPYCQEKTHKERPCNYYSIKQCEGICAKLETIEEYKKRIEQIKKILNGKTDEVEQFLNEKITEAVEAQNYELAGLWRDRLNTLKNTIQDQKIILPQPEDLDLITLVCDKDTNGIQIGSVFVQNIRDGKVINVNNFLLTGTDMSTIDEEADYSQILQRFMISYNHQNSENVKTMVQLYTVEDE